MRNALFATVLVAVFAAPSAAADPVVVYQTQPLGRLLNDLRSLIRSAGGEEAIKGFNDDLKRTLGAKGFEGFDLNRPIFGYVDLPADPEETALVIAFPVTNEKDWLDFVERWQKSKLKPAKDGLYELASSPSLKGAMRIVDGYAYLAGGPKNPGRMLDPKAIIAFNKAYDGADASLFAARLYFDRVPKELRTKAKQALAAFQKKLPKERMGFAEMLIAQPFFGLATRVLELSDGARNGLLQVNADAATGETTIDLKVTPIGGSQLEKVLAGIQPNANRFGGIIGKDAAAGIKLRFPVDIPEVQKAIVGGLEELQKQANNNAFAPLKPTIDELLKGLIRTAKTGDVDGAAVFRGPSKDGTFTAAGGIAFDDPSAFAKELKKSINALAPDVFNNALTWDSEKVNGVGINTLDISKTPGNDDPEFTAVFGRNAVFAFAFAPKAIYAALGPGDEAVKALKEVMAAKPVPAPRVSFEYNPDRIVKLVNATDARGGAMAKKILGTANKLMPLFQIDAAGGKELRVKLVLNPKVFIGTFATRMSSADRAVPVPAPPPPK